MLELSIDNAVLMRRSYCMSRNAMSIKQGTIYFSILLTIALEDGRPVMDLSGDGGEEFRRNRSRG